MGSLDARGCPVSGASPAAAHHFEAALASFQSWRGSVDAPLQRALQEAPGFAMAHVLRAHALVSSRDLRRVRQAQSLLDDAAHLAVNPRERLHLAAIGAAAAGHYDRARDALDALLAVWPRDALALQVAGTFDYYTGDTPRMLARVESVLPSWSPELPGYHALLAQRAFALEETGDYARAEDQARAALALEPLDVRAHHVMAHVFEMTDRPAEGLRWMAAQDVHDAPAGAGGFFTTHCRWHLALFHLALSQPDAALAIHDRFMPARRGADIADLIDAAALLWRLQLQGIAVDTRAQRLAAAWTPHIDDALCTFSDVHAMLAFVAARDWRSAERLLAVLAASQARATRHGRASRELGLPACRALLAFGRGDAILATTLLASLPAVAHRLGGSHAQRDVLHLTLLHAVERVRRPAARAGHTHNRSPTTAPTTAPTKG